MGTTKLTRAPARRSRSVLRRRSRVASIIGVVVAGGAFALASLSPAAADIDDAREVPALTPAASPCDLHVGVTLEEASMAASTEAGELAPVAALGDEPPLKLLITGDDTDELVLRDAQDEAHRITEVAQLADLLRAAAREPCVPPAADAAPTEPPVTEPPAAAERAPVASPSLPAQASPGPATVAGSTAVAPPIAAPVAPPNTGGRALIGDVVWHDTNKDGVPSPGEHGVGGVQVAVTNRDNGDRRIVTTHADGSYQVSVDPGSYAVTLEPPSAGTDLTTPDVYEFSLEDGEEYFGADFGFEDEFESGDVLAFTGSGTTLLMRAGLAALGAGGLLTMLRRVRRQTPTVD